VDRTVRGTSTIMPHPVRPALAVAPHDPLRSVGACRSAIGRPTRPPTSVWASSPRGLLQDSGVLNARITLLPRPVVKDYACPFGPPSYGPRGRSSTIMPVLLDPCMSFSLFSIRDLPPALADAPCPFWVFWVF
jgi:hypothetical protein